MKPVIDVREARLPLLGLAVVAGLHGIFTLVTLALAQAWDSPFVFWFFDTPILLAALLGLLLSMGVVWDGTLVGAGLVADAIGRRGARRTHSARFGVEAMRARRFFTCGPAPIALLLATAVALLGTSNVTLLNMELLANGSHWRDPVLWRLEGAVFEQIVSLPIDVAAWDRLYHSAWLIEVIAAFALIVIGRGLRIVLHYCVTLVVLFYVGRLLGVLNPVMGPAFFRPDLFGYLDGSATAEAMRMVAGVMSMQPEQAMRAGGVLLGGISAMPSLHVAMVSITAYWLFRAARWTAWATVPWVLLVWTSTIVLGWHYVTDGAGGIVLGATCVVAATALLRKLGVDLRPRADIRPGTGVGAALAPRA